jgi:hypothetical protein
MSETTISTHAPPRSVETELSEFYALLLQSQERLGSEFEKVLHDHLWDLLVRT